MTLTTILQKPFSTQPASRFFYLAQPYKEVLNHMATVVMNQEALAIALGPWGSGKSSLLSIFVEWLKHNLEGRVNVAFMEAPEYTTKLQFLKAICRQFKLDEVKTLQDQELILKTFLAEQVQEGKVNVLIIDEGQRLGPKAMELVRDLFNFYSESGFYIHVVMAGEEGSLEKKLQQKKAVYSRAAYVDVLPPLDLAETGNLIRFRLQMAELPADLFTDDAIELIHEASRGLPRIICKVCMKFFDDPEGAPTHIDRDMVAMAIAKNPKVLYA